jgi:hypothetical protein
MCRTHLIWSTRKLRAGTELTGWSFLRPKKMSLLQVTQDMGRQSLSALTITNIIDNNGQI